MAKKKISLIEQKIGDRQFLEPAFFVTLGLFDSCHGVRLALKSGLLPYLKIGSRYKILREDFLRFLEDNYFDS